MKRILVVLALAIGGVSLLTMSSYSETRADPDYWPPLLTCPDTTGSGSVDLGNDILGVILRFGTSYGETNPDSGLKYALIYDVSGGNFIDLGDVLGVILRFGEECPLIDRQVALTVQALMPYQDCQDALADGYVQVTQFVPNMGIHLQKTENVALPFFSGSFDDPNDQIRKPAGLLCTDSDPTPGVSVPGDLIGPWGAVPDPNVCPYYGIDPATCSFIEPIGYGLTNTDEDNIDLDSCTAPGCQRAWHSHFNMCIGGSGTTSFVVADIPSLTEANCYAGAYGSCIPTCVWFDHYSWMSHLYAFIPNPAGRFQMWSSLVPGSGQSPGGAGSGSGAVAGFDPDNPLLCFFNPEIAEALAEEES